MSRRKRTARTSSSRQRKVSMPVLLIAVPVAALILVGGYLVAAGRLGRPVTREGQPAGAVPAQAAEPGRVPVLSVSGTVYDLGQVSQARGIVTVQLAVVNTGSADLVIEEMETSCGCTRAALVVGGRPGPWFGMRGHGDWPTGWSARLRPGEKGTLQVQYDPDAHGIYRGPIDREVIIYSNDARRRDTRIRLTGTQVP